MFWTFCVLSLLQKFWEAGGNCNLAFAAARLGLSCSTLGHVGEEIYGKFLLDVLQAEGISVVGMLENTNATACRQAYETLLCWVLVDPFQKHGFCRLEHAFWSKMLLHISITVTKFMSANPFYWLNVLGFLSVMLSLQCQSCRLQRRASFQLDT